MLFEITSWTKVSKGHAFDLPLLNTPLNSPTPHFHIMGIYKNWYLLYIMTIMYKLLTSNIEDLPMDSINSTDAKKSFSDVVLKVQQEPVWITRHDKPVAVVMSAKEYQEILALKERVLKMELEKGFDSLKAGKVIDGQDAINKLMQTIDNA